MGAVVTDDDVPRATLEALAARLGIAARWREPLAPHTSMRVGGAADLFLPARRNEQIVAGLQAAFVLGVPCRVIGGASNLLVADGGIAGLVIKSLVQGVRYVPHPTEPGHVTAVAAAGCLFASLARDCARRGLAGLVWASNVPGTVGAAVVNNAGAFGSATAEVLERALLVDAAGQTRYVTAADLAMGYRTTRLKRREIEGVVLAVELRLQVGDAASLLAELQQVREQRRRTQPAGFSLGSTFMNPPGDAAGRLIEAAGLKGRRVGGAEISRLHANFLLNRGGATAQDVYALMRQIQDAVFMYAGVWLLPEVQLVGRWDAGQLAALAAPSPKVAGPGVGADAASVPPGTAPDAPGVDSGDAGGVALANQRLTAEAAARAGGR